VKARRFLWNAVLASLIGATLAPPLHAQTAAGRQDDVTAASAALEAAEARTMRIVTSGSPNIGTQILGTSELMRGRTTELTVLDGQIASQLPLYGRIIDWERISDRRIGTHIVRRAYVVRHERMVTIWYIAYVQLPDRWQVVGITFNDRVQDFDTNW
jgi:hypothetical protein